MPKTPPNLSRGGGHGLAQPTENGHSLCSCPFLLIDETILVFDRYQEGVSDSVFFFVALAVVLYFDDDCS